MKNDGDATKNMNDQEDRTSDSNIKIIDFKKSQKDAPIPLLARITARNMSPSKMLQKHLDRQ